MLQRIQASYLFQRAVFVLMFLIMYRCSIHAEGRLQYGINYANLTWEGADVQERTLDAIRDMKVQWFRDTLSGDSFETNMAFVRELELAKRNHLKFLAIVGPDIGDYDTGYRVPNAGADFNKRCGWPSGSLELSKINLNKFTARLRAQLRAVKEAGLSIDAFEIGNEYDWICFNGDVPDGHSASQKEFMGLVKGYAAFLRAAATLIHNKAYFPDAQIITFGMAHIPDTFDMNHHIENPERILTALRNLMGFNYLENEDYHVAGVGSHIYPAIDQINARTTDVIGADSRATGNKPVWITEWGFNKHSFLHQPVMTRGEAISRFYDFLDQQKTPLGPNFFYAYSEHRDHGWGLIDENGNLLREAAAIKQRTERQ